MQNPKTFDAQLRAAFEAGRKFEHEAKRGDGDRRDEVPTFNEWRASLSE